MSSNMAGPKIEKKTVAVGKNVQIPKLNDQKASFLIQGTAPYVQNKFSNKAKGEMHATQEAGSRAKKGVKRTAKDFQQCYEDSKHISTEGWCGFPASAFRIAIIRACSVVGFKMTLAKMSIFIEPDGFDEDEGTGLVKITKGEPHYVEHTVRNATGVVDLRARAMWDPGWQAVVRVTWDGDQFSLEDVTNLMVRVGIQVGIGEGRPFSSNSAGMGWGTFEII